MSKKFYYVKYKAGSTGRTITSAGSPYTRKEALRVAIDLNNAQSYGGRTPWHIWVEKDNEVVWENKKHEQQHKPE
jgi:hypothetical protein